MIFYGGQHAIYLLFAVATVILSLAMTRGACAKWVAYLGFATAALDIAGSYPWVIGPGPLLVCELAFAGWLLAVGSQLGNRCKLHGTHRPRVAAGEEGKS